MAVAADWSVVQNEGYCYGAYGCQEVIDANATTWGHLRNKEELNASAAEFVPGKPCAQNGPGTVRALLHCLLENETMPVGAQAIRTVRLLEATAACLIQHHWRRVLWARQCAAWELQHAQDLWSQWHSEGPRRQRRRARSVASKAASPEGVGNFWHVSQKAWLRSGPSLDSKVLADLLKGEVVQQIGPELVLPSGVIRLPVEAGSCKGWATRSATAVGGPVLLQATASSRPKQSARSKSRSSTRSSMRSQSARRWVAVGTGPRDHH